MKKTPWSLVASAIGAPLLLLGLAACASDPATAPAASSQSSSSQGASSTGDYEKASDAWTLKMVQCLRSEGVDVSDPKPGEGFPDMKGDQALIQKAKSTCSGKIGDPPLPPAASRMSDADYIKWGTVIAQCVRDAGYDATDPTSETALTIGSDERPDVPDDVMTTCGEKGNAAIGK